MPTTILSYNDLKDKGIPYSRSHLRRLIKQGKFPKPFQLNSGATSPFAWTERQIDRHIEARIAAAGVAERDGAAAA